MAETLYRIPALRWKKSKTRGRFLCTVPGVGSWQIRTGCTEGHIAAQIGSFTRVRSGNEFVWRGEITGFEEAKAKVQTEYEARLIASGVIEPVENPR